MVLSMVSSGAVALGSPGTDETVTQVQSGVSEDVQSDEALPEAEELVVRFTPHDTTELPIGDRQGVVDALQAHADQTQAAFIDAMAERDDVTVENTFWIANAALVSVDSGLDTEVLTEQPNVVDVHENYEFEQDELHGYEQVDADEFSADQEFTYGHEQINASDVWDEFGVRGAGIEVAILDSGLSPDHPDVAPRFPEENWAHFDEDGDPVDSEPFEPRNHGTWVAGITGREDPPAGDVPTQGVAPEVEFWGVKVLDDGGSGTFTQIIAGHEFVTEETDVDVTANSYSSGAPTGTAIEAVENMVAAGIIPSYSVGNAGQGISGSPANYWTAFASGAIDENEQRAGFSSGQVIDTDQLFPDAPAFWPDEYVQPDAAAAGVNTLAPDHPEGYAEVSGTSFSQPHKAGTLALMLDAAGFEPESFDDVEEFFDGIRDTAREPNIEDPPGEFPNTEFGYGVVDAPAAVDELAADQGLEGTVTGPDGDPIEGATVEIPELGLTAITYEEAYNLYSATTGEFEATVSADGFDPITETVEIVDGEFQTEDFQFEDEQLEVELVDGQPASVTDGSEIGVTVDVANLETLTIEQIGDYDGALDLFVAGQPAEFGEPIELGGFTGEADVVVETETGVEGTVELEHTFEGAGDEIVVTTGPTEVVESEGTVIAGSDDDNIYGFEAATGEQLWEVETGSGVRSSATVYDGLAYIGSFGGSLRAIEPTTGDVVWENSEPGAIFSSPAVKEVDGTTKVIVGTNTPESVFAFDGETGEILWEQPAPTDGVSASPYIDSERGLVYIAAETMWALDLETGDAEWQNDAPADIPGSPNVDDDRVYIGDRGANAVHAFDADDGELLWSESPMADDVFGGVSVSEDGEVVYAASRDSNLYALDAETGETVAEITEPEADVIGHTLADGVLYFGTDTDDDPKVHAADAATGEILWTFDSEESVGSHPTVDDGVVYVGAGTDRFFGPDEGFVYALDAETGEEIWSFNNPGDGVGFFSSPTIATDTDEGVFSTGSRVLSEVWGQHDFEPAEEPDPPAEATITVGDANVTTEFPEDSVTIAAEFDEVAGYQTFLEFDPDDLTIENVVPVEIDQVEFTIDNENGEVNVAGTQPEGLTDPQLVEVVFNASALEPGSETELTPVDGFVNDELSEITETDLEAGTIVSLDGELGDVLGDGQVTAADATVIQRFVAGLEIPVDPERVETFGDVTQTGEVTSADVVAVLQIVVDPEVDPPAPDDDNNGAETNAITPSAQVGTTTIDTAITG